MAFVPDTEYLSISRPAVTILVSLRISERRRIFETFAAQAHQEAFKIQTCLTLFWQYGLSTKYFFLKISHAGHEVTSKHYRAEQSRLTFVVWSLYILSNMDSNFPHFPSIFGGHIQFFCFPRLFSLQKSLDFFERTDITWARGMSQDTRPLKMYHVTTFDQWQPVIRYSWNTIALKSVIKMSQILIISA